LDSRNLDGRHGKCWEEKGVISQQLPFKIEKNRKSRHGMIFHRFSDIQKMKKGAQKNPEID
jgi:hypothetical protein